MSTNYFGEGLRAKLGEFKLNTKHLQKTQGSVKRQSAGQSREKK